MRHLPRRHPRLFRALLGLALLAWAALALGAFAHPLVMPAEMDSEAAVAVSKTASSHCDGMAGMEAAHAEHPAPSHPAGTGHGCCANGGCYCASLCNGMAGVPYLNVRIQPPHDPILLPIRVAPALIAAAPPLRPPIA